MPDATVISDARYFCSGIRESSSIDFQWQPGSVLDSLQVIVRHGFWIVAIMLMEHSDLNSFRSIFIQGEMGDQKHLQLAHSGAYYRPRIALLPIHVASRRIRFPSSSLHA